MLKLTDPSLLKTRCLINGEWLDADDASTIDVVNPATGVRDRQRAAHGRGRNRARRTDGSIRFSIVA